MAACPQRPAAPKCLSPRPNYALFTKAQGLYYDYYLFMKKTGNKPEQLQRPAALFGRSLARGDC